VTTNLCLPLDPNVTTVINISLCTSAEVKECVELTSIPPVRLYRYPRTESYRPSRGSRTFGCCSVSIVTRLWSERPGFDSRQEHGFLFLFATAFRPSLGSIRFPIQGVPGVKRPRHVADDLPPCGAQSKNAWSCTCTPPYVCMAWCLVKHIILLRVWYFITRRGKFSFTFE
jgi:hypothetical protein